MEVFLYEETEGDYKARYSLYLRDTEKSIDFALKEGWYKENHIPYQYWGPPLGAAEKLENNPETKACPICGYKVLVQGTRVYKAVTDDGSCRVCPLLKYNSCE